VQDNRDFALLKSGDELVHVEYENKTDNAFGELLKLHKSQAPIKRIVSYSKTDEIQEYVNLLLSPIVVNFERLKKNSELADATKGLRRVKRCSGRVHEPSSSNLR
jgi:hypothetical protein